MPKTREQKKKIVEELFERLPKAKIVMFASFAREGEKGLSVSQSQELKKNLKSTDSEYFVSKKTLIDVALKQASYSDTVDASQLNGSLGLIFGYGDVVSAAKTAYMFSKTNQALSLLGALMDKKFIGAEKLVELAKLPAKEVLLGEAVGLIGSPLSGLVNVLQGNLRNLVLVLSNIKK